MVGEQMLDEAVDHVTTWGELILAVGGAIMALWYGARRVYNIARNVETLLDNVAANGKQANEVIDRLSKIEYQLHPNGGSSLADQIAEIRSRVQILEHHDIYSTQNPK